MKTATDIYDSSENLWGWSDYTPMIEAFGEVATSKESGNYQGDTRVLYSADDTGENRYGYLCFGWGSCSGCDSLQACSTIAEVQELMDELRQAIKWFDSKADALVFFQTHDWDGDYYNDSAFVAECIEILSK